MWKKYLIIVLVMSTFVGCRQPGFQTTQTRPRLFNWGTGQGSWFNRTASTQNVAQNTQRSSFWQNPFSRNRVAQNPFGQNGIARNANNVQIQTNSPQEYQQYAQLAQELDSLNQQVGSFDSDNQQLHIEVAGLKQKLQVANDYNNQLKQQITDNTTQLQQFQFEKQSIEQQLANTQLTLNQSQQQIAAQTDQLRQSELRQNEIQGRFEYANTNGGGVPSRQLGGATLRANNSLMQKISQIQIPGGQARMDGDVIRIEFPSDRLFSLGSYQVHPSQVSTLQSLANTIQQHFPNQIIGIEAHWDGSQLNPSTVSHHQLTATQALSIFDTLKQFGLPESQIFTMGMGSNRPRHPQGTAGGISPNRRIEVVIYPENYNS